MFCKTLCCLCAFLTTFGVHAQDVKAMTDDEIREAIVLGGLNSYQGECPCPYTKDSNGRLCGNNSEYFINKGKLACYKEDIDISEVNSYRMKNSVVDPNFVPDNSKPDAFKKFEPPAGQYAPYVPPPPAQYP